jgi:hypothetical protein
MFMVNYTQRLALALRQEWPVEVAAEWYDLPLTYVEKYGTTSGNVDRFLVEAEIYAEGRIGLNLLALRFGVPKDALLKVMQHPPKGLGAFPLEAYGDDGRYLLPLGFTQAWVEELLPRHKRYFSLDERAQDLAAAIGCETRVCAVSKMFGEEPPRVATRRCIVTWDDVSSSRKEDLSTNKGFFLELDCVGWHAIYNDLIPRYHLLNLNLEAMEGYFKMYKSNL